MATTADLFSNYLKLCDYCETFWKRVAFALGDQIVCKKGCSICCELPSVNLLEARLIADYCADHPESYAPSAAKPQTASGQDGTCLFLTDGACRIYEARPLICRTHGLLLHGDSFRVPVSFSCPYNFAHVDPATIDMALVLDIEKVSDNLARLNAAYCLLMGDIGKATRRVPLRDLALGRVTDTFFSRPGV